VTFRLLKGARKTSVRLPPHRWLLRQRMEKAKDLLARSTLSLDEIASACGFVTEAQLSRVFTREVGVPPRLWCGAEM
jgi:transcriptional regulator GlxA family with amidase domain